MDVFDPEHRPCSAWSAHAADLAEAWAHQLQQWPETPTTAGLLADGLLVQLRPGVLCPPDLLDRVVPRALLLGAAVGPQLRADHVIGGESAAWVFIGGRPPLRPVLHTPAHRTVIGGVRIRHVTLDAGDVETIGGAPITVPARTAVDLLRFPEQTDAVGIVRDLLLSGHLDERSLITQLHRFRGRPGSLIAERGLRELGILAAAA